VIFILLDWNIIASIVLLVSKHAAKVILSKFLMVTDTH